MSTEIQRRTITVEAVNSTSQTFVDGQRLAWGSDGAVSMTLRVGPHSIWFEKGTCPAGIRLPSYDTEDEDPSWSIGGGGMRTSAEAKLTGLVRSGWERVDDDVGLNR
jgi:hypothetical protein